MNMYIMRWNPGISSSKIEEYREARKRWPEGFCHNWSIYEWQHAHEGDLYVMVRVGEGANGIVYMGGFMSEPYEGDDWAGTDRKRYYVDITVENHCDPDEPCITAAELEAVMPEIDWRKGHSGQRLTPEQKEKLMDILGLEVR